jgi:imidazolonepropionase-like amidohydrolase
VPLSGKDVAASPAGTFTSGVSRILFVNGLVFDGTGSPAVPADVVVRGDRIESVRVGGGTQAGSGDQVVDCAGATVMPGLVESHSHLTFPSAVGHIDPSFNPPLDVSFFRRSSGARSSSCTRRPVRIEP